MGEQADAGEGKKPDVDNVKGEMMVKLEKRKVLAAKKVNADAKTALKKEEIIIEEAKDNLKKAEEKKQAADEEAARETDPVKKDVINRKAEEAADEVSARKTEVVDELKKKSTVLRDLAKDEREVVKAEASLAAAKEQADAGEGKKPDVDDVKGDMMVKLEKRKVLAAKKVNADA